ncbi:MAG: F0F1 ATP synthase subunit A [Alphaproteobacteria bacterium]
MDGANPLQPDILFALGPVPISRAVATTWGIVAALGLGAWLAMRRPRLDPGPVQAMLEIVVETIATQVSDIAGKPGARLLPLLATLFLFLAFANLSAVLPGVQAPTAHIETPAALALVVFFSVHYFGIRGKGLRGYLAHYLRPSPLMLPLNVLAEITRTFSLMIRLFGNMMSHEIVIAIVALLAGLFVPIPFLLLGILIGLIQAYIFTVLAAVYLGAAIGSVQAE